MRLFRIALLGIVLTGCAADGMYNPVVTNHSVNPVTGELRSQPAVEHLQTIEVSAETGVGAGALVMFGHPVRALGLPGTIFNPANSALLYVIYDPMAPNWTIQERMLGADTYELSLRAKSFRVGGDGEAYQILKRRALYLQRATKGASYRILDYSEGIESSTPLTHRVGSGVIQLVRTESSPKR